MKSEAALDGPRLVERDGPSIQLRAGRMVIIVPMQFKRRGSRKEIIVPRNAKYVSTAVVDNPAIQKPLAVAVARAHRWQDSWTRAGTRAAAIWPTSRASTAPTCAGSSISPCFLPTWCGPSWTGASRVGCRLPS